MQHFPVTSFCFHSVIVVRKNALGEKVSNLLNVKKSASFSPHFKFYRIEGNNIEKLSPRDELFLFFLFSYLLDLIHLCDYDAAKVIL